MPTWAENSPVFEGYSQQTGLPGYSEKGEEIAKTTAIAHSPKSHIVLGYILQYKTGPYLFLWKENYSC